MPRTNAKELEAETPAVDLEAAAPGPDAAPVPITISPEVEQFLPVLCSTCMRSLASCNKLTLWRQFMGATEIDSCGIYVPRDQPTGTEA